MTGEHSRKIACTVNRTNLPSARSTRNHQTHTLENIRRLQHALKTRDLLQAQTNTSDLSEVSGKRRKFAARREIQPEAMPQPLLIARIHRS